MSAPDGKEHPQQQQHVVAFAGLATAGVAAPEPEPGDVDEDGD